VDTSIQITKSFMLGVGQPIALIAGPCVIESAEMVMETGKAIHDICKKRGIPYIFKTSYTKANRLSGDSYRGPGLNEGLKILEQVKGKLGLPILTDIHVPMEAKVVAEVADILQIPAFLCRQTELLEAAANTGRVVNIKKGQFLSPEDMIFAVQKVRNQRNSRVIVTERGTHFGYRDLVVDMRGLVELRNTRCPVVFDATHSVQIPGGAGKASGGKRQYVPILAKAALATGCVDALFLEVHPNPDKAKSDMATQWQLDKLDDLLQELELYFKLPRLRAGNNVL
jgi:2-dehydro-3-deoxyphosphooctonate aldolase (KDO 8-P synthase)